MLNPRIELTVTLTLTVLILVGLFLTNRIDLAFSSDLETYSGPRAYPGLILSVLLFFNLLTAIGLGRRILRGTNAHSDEQPFLSERFLQAAGLFLALIVFVLTFETAGYIVAMVPLLTIAALLCGAKSMIKAFVVSILLAMICLIIFRYGLATVLPEGVLGVDMLF